VPRLGVMAFVIVSSIRTCCAICVCEMQTVCARLQRCGVLGRRRQGAVHGLHLPAHRLHQQEHSRAAGVRFRDEGRLWQLAACQHTVDSVFRCLSPGAPGTDVSRRRDLQDLYHGFNRGDETSIFVFVAVFAAAQLLLSQLPTMRHLRHLNAAAVACTAAFVVIVTVECITDGALPLKLCAYQVAHHIH
jgi:hypothetical protein